MVQQTSYVAAKGSLFLSRPQVTEEQEENMVFQNTVLIRM